VLAAIVAHLYIAWIHPFGDGNGRTARLVEFALLVKAGIPMPAAHLLSNHYNETRSAYYRHLDLASKDLDQGIYDFVQYAVQGLVDGLREQIARVRVQQLEVAWQNFVHEHFKSATAAQKRQRDVVLAMSMKNESLSSSEIMGLTPGIATAYAAGSPQAAGRKLKRDIDTLIKANLIRKVGSRLQANKEIMAAFLPPRANAQAKE
jgi:Fic family protein